MTKVKENKEIIDGQNLIKKWYSDYISLLNLTINNGTLDMLLKFNDELHKLMNRTNFENKNNKRILDEKAEILRINNENEICFVKINFYENGNIKDIFYPEGFDLDKMVYINKIS